MLESYKNLKVITLGEKTYIATCDSISSKMEINNAYLVYENYVDRALEYWFQKANCKELETIGVSSKLGYTISDLSQDNIDKAEILYNAMIKAKTKMVSYAENSLYKRMISGKEDF